MQLRDQCEKTDRVRKLKEKEGIGCQRRQNLVYEGILQFCRDLKSSFEDESNSFRKPQTLHDLLLILIYLHFVPRAHELRTLILEQEIPAGEIVATGPNRQNARDSSFIG